MEHLFTSSFQCIFDTLSICFFETILVAIAIAMPLLLCATEEGKLQGTRLDSERVIVVVEDADELASGCRKHLLFVEVSQPREELAVSLFIKWTS